MIHELAQRIAHLEKLVAELCRFNVGMHQEGASVRGAHINAIHDPDAKLICDMNPKR